MLLSIASLIYLEIGSCEGEEGIGPLSEHQSLLLQVTILKVNISDLLVVYYMLSSYLHNGFVAKRRANSTLWLGMSCYH